MRVLPPSPVILTAVSAFERRASVQLLRRPWTEELATSAITRLCAERAEQRNGSVAALGMMSPAAVMPIPAHRSLLVRAVEKARRLPIVAQSVDRFSAGLRLQLGLERKCSTDCRRGGLDPQRTFDIELARAQCLPCGIVTRFVHPSPKIPAVERAQPIALEIHPGDRAE
jgi:hypothetical protein